jgi:hypothetical protein
MERQSLIFLKLRYFACAMSSILLLCFFCCMRQYNHILVINLVASTQTIGQAYEDMQTQNQHLLQQVMERDDYNIKVIILILHLLIVIGQFCLIFSSCIWTKHVI